MREEQQIAEMAATIAVAHVFDDEDYAMETAKALYKAGYRKLTDREIKILRQVQGMEETRKEVEREFLGETE